jgi:2-aminoadipate transaminase
MRLNFSGVTDDRIREGVRRVGEVVHEQIDLLGTLRGTRPSGDAAAQAPEEAPARDQALADVLHLPRREDDGRTGTSSGA